MWFRKLSAIMVLSFGAAMAYLPFPEHLEGEHQREVVTLRVQNSPFTEAEARADFGADFVVLSYEEMESVPEVREMILALMGDSGTVCPLTHEWRRFLRECSVEDPVGLVYAFRDGLYEIIGTDALDDGSGDGPTCVEVVFLGAYDNRDWQPVAWLEAGDLEGYPELQKELERLAAGPLPNEGGRAVSPREWRRFHRRVLDDDVFLPTFVVHDRLFSGLVEDEPADWTLRAHWLRPAARSFGIAALILGIVVLLGSYRASTKRPGIPLSPLWLAVFADAISIIAALIFVPVAIDTLWVSPLGQPSLIGLVPEWPSDQPITGLHFISIPVVLLALPLFTLFTSSLTGQRVAVDADRVTSYGALGLISISWDELETARVREQKNPFAFTVVDFRSLQKVVDLEGDDGCVTLNEPASRKRKALIVYELLEHAPADKKALIEEIKKSW